MIKILKAIEQMQDRDKLLNAESDNLKETIEKSKVPRFYFKLAYHRSNPGISFYSDYSPLFDIKLDNEDIEYFKQKAIRNIEKEKEALKDKYDKELEEMNSYL